MLPEDLKGDDITGKDMIFPGEDKEEIDVLNLDDNLSQTIKKMWRQDRRKLK